MFYLLLSLGITFSVLILRSLDNEEYHNIYNTLRKCGQELGEELAYQYIKN